MHSVKATRPARVMRVLVLAVVISMGLRIPVGAQAVDEIWAPPVNVSLSGAASAPVVLTGPDGAMRVLWWDSLDGLTMAERTQGEWSEPVTTPIYLVEALDNPLPDGSEALYTPIRAMPQIVGDSSGNAHAFWVGEVGEGSRATPLMYSELPAGNTKWSNARAIAESAASFAVTADTNGWLYLAYSRNLHTAADPSAIVFRRSTNGGDAWSQAVAIHSSLYYRAATAEQMNLRIATIPEDLVVLTWNDPHLAQAYLAESTDSGDVWSAPVSVGGGRDGAAASNARAFATYGEPAGGEVLWEGTDSLGACALYQLPLEDVLTGAGGVGKRVLEGLNGCPSSDGERFVPFGAGQVIMLTGGGTDALTLSLWNGEVWSEPQRLSVRFEDAATGRSVYLGEPWATLAADESQDAASAALAVVGVDAGSDVWVTQSQISALDIAFASPSPWSAPVAVLLDSAGADVPTMAADGEGVVHALWSELTSAGGTTKVLRYARWSGTGWTRAATVLQSSTGSAVEPSVVVAGDCLHAVWSEGPDGQIRYSRAFLPDAYSAGGWDDSRVLPGATSDTGVGSGPQIVSSEPGGRLHVIYAVPVNEGRGIYYVTSDDAGVTWSDALPVFDAAGAGWASVEQPRLAVDPWGTLHVVWVRASLGVDSPSLGVYYAYSQDCGQTWSAPLLVADGDYIWPDIVADGMGGVHMFWNRASTPRSWWHQWSRGAAGGMSGGREAATGWERAAQVPGFSDVEGRPAVAGDGALGLQAVGLGLDSAGEPALIHQTWSSSVEVAADGAAPSAQAGGRWEGLETYRLDPAPAGGGVSAVLQPQSGHLDVLYRAVMVDTDAGEPGLWHTGRMVSVTTLDSEFQPVGAPVTMPSATVSIAGPTEPVMVATEVSSSAGDFASAPASDGQSSMVPLLVSGGLAAMIIIGVFGSRWWMKRRA